MKLRPLLVRLLLLLETLITLPVFAVAWFISALGVAIVAGWHFARMDDETAKASALRQMLGERTDT